MVRRIAAVALAASMLAATPARAVPAALVVVCDVEYGYSPDEGNVTTGTCVVTGSHYGTFALSGGRAWLPPLCAVTNAGYALLTGTSGTVSGLVLYLTWTQFSAIGVATMSSGDVIGAGTLISTDPCVTSMPHETVVLTLAGV